MNNVLNKLIKIAEEICSLYDIDVYDIELKNTQKGKVVLILITKENGVSIDDCTRISRNISIELETLDLFKDKYFLEVSSAGLERKLKKPKHFESAIGEKINVSYYDEILKTKSIKGIMKSCSSKEITIEKEEEEIVIPISSIKKARTVFEFNKNLK